MYVFIHTHLQLCWFLCPAIYIANHGGVPPPRMDAFLSPANAFMDCKAQTEEGIKDYFFNVSIKTNFKCYRLLSQVPPTS